MKIIAFILLLHLCCLSTAQVAGTYYFGPNNKPLDNEAGARTKLDIIIKDEFSFQVESFRMKETGWSPVSVDKVKIRSEDKYGIRRYVSKVLQEKITRIYEMSADSIYTFTDHYMGKIIRTGESSSKIPLVLENNVTEYHPKGNKKSESNYRQNQLISNTNWLPDGEKYIDNLFYSVDSDPVYPGGTRAIHTYLYQYITDKISHTGKLLGTVLVRFVVMENGKISGVLIESGIEPSLDRVVAEAVSNLPGKWKPGELDGKQVRCSLTVPVNFLRVHEGRMFDFLDYSSGMLFW
ncbi:MAG TPA: hypothetical protein ENI20_15580 [Bacteroides sp.]|nr:hypothetical protein [Bacteroides sp.]